jgi:DNA-binding MarR family transcriptional regulator
MSMHGAFEEWVTADENPSDIGFRDYMHSVAQARYVVRKVIRIVHEEAKRAGLDPLEHQALVQVFGAIGEALSVNQLAERLDIAPALASRIIKGLEKKSLVVREQSPEDKRVIHVSATDSGIAVLKEIDAQVHVHIDYFQKQLRDSDRLALMSIFAFWAGVDADSRIGDAIRTAVFERSRSRTEAAASAS